jgi:hypothetical protein
MSELKLVYSPRLVMSNAWRRAREGVWLFGGRPVSYFRAALRQAWAAARSPAAAAAAMRERVKASVASLAADLAAVDAFMARLYAKDEAARPVPATVLPFPSRRPVVPAVPARRVA